MIHTLFDSHEKCEYVMISARQAGQLDGWVAGQKSVFICLFHTMVRRVYIYIMIQPL